MVPNTVFCFVGDIYLLLLASFGRFDDYLWKSLCELCMHMH